MGNSQKVNIMARPEFELTYYKIRDAFNKFPDLFVQAFKNVIDSRKISMLWQTNFYDFWF